MAWVAPRTWTVGELVTAAKLNEISNSLNASRFVAVRKTSDESVSSSTTNQSDDLLVFAIAASEVWAFKFVLFIDAATAGDFKYGFTYPASATLAFGSLGLDVTTASQTGDLYSIHTTAGGTPTHGGTGAGNYSTVVIHGTVLNSTNAGNVQLQWAQGTSSGTATVVKAGSFLVAHRVA